MTLFRKSKKELNIPEEGIEKLSDLIEKNENSKKFVVTEDGMKYINEKVDEFKEYNPLEYQRFTDIAVPIIDKLFDPNYCKFCDKVKKTILVHKEFRICKSCYKKRLKSGDQNGN